MTQEIGLRRGKGAEEARRTVEKNDLTSRKNLGDSHSFMAKGGK